jgi:uncharacterized glyoxalase superfamily protein PhnB
MPKKTKAKSLARKSPSRKSPPQKPKLKTKAKSVAAKSVKAPAIQPVPEGIRTVTPHLICGGAAEAIEFYKKAFGATEVMRLPGADGKLIHASIRIGDSAVYLVDEFPAWGSFGPLGLKGTTVTIHLSVPDVDQWWARAVGAGCTVKLPLADMFWGDRYGQVTDPFGHVWSLSTHTREVGPDELQKAMQAAGM